MLHLKTFTLAILGVVIARMINLPLPFLLGPLLFLTLLSVLNVKLAFTHSLSSPIFALLGIYLGGSIIGLGFAVGTTWLLSGLYMIIFSLLATLLCAWYFVKFAGFSKEEAVLAGLPGALAYIISYCIESGVSTSKIIIPQTIRVIIIVAIAPWIYRFINNYEGSIVKHFIWQPLELNMMIDLAVIVILTMPILLLFKKINAPNAWFLAGMVSAMLAYSFGVVDTQLPEWIIQIILIFIGTMIGVRLSKITHKALAQYSWHGVLSTLLLLLLTLVAAWLGALVFDQEFIAMFLAFAPGGVHEMVLIAVVYSVEPLFVSFHHLLRIVLISFLIPLTAKLKS